MLILGDEIRLLSFISGVIVEKNALIVISSKERERKYMRMKAARLFEYCSDKICSRRARYKMTAFSIILP